MTRLAQCTIFDNHKYIFLNLAESLKMLIFLTWNENAQNFIVHCTKLSTYTVNYKSLSTGVAKSRSLHSIFVTFNWCTMMSLGLWSFDFGGSYKSRFLAKSQHTPRKLLLFVNRPNARSWKTVLYVKNQRVFHCATDFFSFFFHWISI